MADKIHLERDYGAEYEPTDSDEEYSEEEKELLQEVRRGKEDQNKSKKRELMAFADSDDDDDDEDDDDAADSDDVKDLMHDSDIEGADGDGDDDLPNEMDWGKKSRNYYNTDFVDPDYSAYTAEEAELAKQEEEEAKTIQQRLAKQMKEQDFLLDDALFKTEKATTKQSAQLTETTKLTADFSGLTKREKQQLFQKDSPEFAALMGDFKTLMKEVDTLHNPILKYVEAQKMPMIPALEFTQLYRNLALTYCSNISFYLLLKAKRIGVRNHPMTKRLAQLKKLLLQLQDKYDNIIKPQLEALLERIVDGDEFEILEIKPTADIAAKKARKSKLSILDQYKVDDNDEEQVDEDDDIEDDDKHAGVLQSTDEEADEDGDGIEDEYADMDEDARRGITYEMAKNKGLTPHRKKEARNPRVKHRSKFRKALIRRKGAVRSVRKETKRYGGEISGIKSTVVKSVKFKT